MIKRKILELITSMAKALSPSSVLRKPGETIVNPIVPPSSVLSVSKKFMMGTETQYSDTYGTASMQNPGRSLQLRPKSCLKLSSTLP